MEKESSFLSLKECSLYVMFLGSKCLCTTGQVGMRVLEVNDSSLLGITHEEAVGVMRSAGSTIRLVVCDGYDYSLVSSFPLQGSLISQISIYT